MTKKDYIAIAKIIYNNQFRIEDIEFYNFVDDFCDYFKQDNPNFNKDKFMEACGL